MKIITILKNLHLYQFPPNPGKEYGFNVYALISNKEVLLIDTAYEVQAEQVFSDLKNKGLTITRIHLSHSHEDHIHGLKVLPKTKISGSAEIDSLTLKELSIETFQPLDGASKIKFGDFQLQFKSAPGHSPCSLCTRINDKIIHAGDLLIATNMGKPIVPFVYEGAQHLRSLKMLQELAPQTLLLGHGSPIHGEKKIREEIAKRIKYIEAVWQAKGAISYEDAAAASQTAFACENWHAHNQKQARI